MRFKKAPLFMGKYLSIYVGGGDKVIRDDEILDGAQWSKYVGLGMLVPVPDELPKAPPQAPKPMPKPAVVAAVAKPQPVAPPPPPPPPLSDEAPTMVPKAEAEPVVEPEEQEAPDGTTRSPAGKWGGGRKRQKGK